MGNLLCHSAAWAALLSDATAHSLTRTVAATGSALALVFTTDLVGMSQTPPTSFQSCYSDVHLGSRVAVSYSLHL